MAKIIWIIVFLIVYVTTQSMVEGGGTRIAKQVQKLISKMCPRPECPDLVQAVKERGWVSTTCTRVIKYEGCACAR